MGRGARAEVWNARRIDLPRWRSVGGGVLVPKGAFQDFDAPDADHDLRRCQLRGVTPRATGWSRSQPHRLTRWLDAPRVSRSASHVEGGPISSPVQAARPWGGNTTQALQKGPEQSCDAQAYSLC